MYDYAGNCSGSSPPFIFTTISSSPLFSYSAIQPRRSIPQMDRRGASFRIDIPRACTIWIFLVSPASRNHPLARGSCPVKIATRNLLISRNAVGRKGKRGDAMAAPGKSANSRIRKLSPSTCGRESFARRSCYCF